jgi:hypothetical protein
MLRVAGASWRQVCEIVGYSNEANAVRAVRRYFGRLPQPDHEELRGLWRERHELLWRQTQDSIREDKPGALRAGVAVARSAAQLDGLDRPAELAIYYPSDEEFNATIAALKELVAAGRPKEADIFAIEE